MIDVERKRSPLVIDKFVGYAMALMITALIFFVPTDQFGVRIGMSTSAYVGFEQRQAEGSLGEATIAP